MKTLQSSKQIKDEKQKIFEKNMDGDEVLKRMEKMNLAPSSQIIKLWWFSIIILWFKFVFKRIKFKINTK